jgi:hypothetical protein
MPVRAINLAGSGITEVKVMGGTAAIADAVVAELMEMGITVERVAGADRAETAVEIAKERGAESAADVAQVIVVDGFGEDAWAAGFAAAARSAGAGGFAQVGAGAPIVLGNVDSLPPATVEWLVPGPEAITCALTRSVCEQARLEVGFDASLQVEVPSGAVTFTVTDGSSSAVYAALADGTPLGLAFTCATAACTELDWDQTGAHLAVLEVGTGINRLQGQTLAGDVTGLLRIAPLDGGEVTVQGLDVNSVPHWMPDGTTVVVLADTADGVALVSADAATGDSEVLVADAGDAAGGRIEADPSGTFISWRAGNEIRVLDTRDGSVATISPPDGFSLAGGPAIRP